MLLSRRPDRLKALSGELRRAMLLRIVSAFDTNYSLMDTFEV